MNIIKPLYGTSPVVEALQHIKGVTVQYETEEQFKARIEANRQEIDEAIERGCDLFDVPVVIARSWAVTGTKHGSIIFAEKEGQARRAFHAAYNGESILSCEDRNKPGYFARLLIANDKAQDQW